VTPTQHRAPSTQRDGTITVLSIERHVLSSQYAGT
jgi:hypothetical protein